MVSGVLAGMVLGSGATGVATLSKVVWRLAHVVQQRESASVSVDGESVSVVHHSAVGSSAWHQRSKWIHRIGTLLLVPTILLDLAAFALAPQSIVAATAGTASVFNLVLAPRILHEPWGRWDVIGSTLVMAGCVGVAAADGSRTAREYTYDQLLMLFVEPIFLWFVFGALIYFALLTAGMVMLAPDAHASKLSAALEKIAWGTIGGSLAGCFFFISVTMQFLTMKNAAPFERWQSYLIGAGAAACPLCGFALLNEGLRRYDALFITPAFQASMVFMGTVSGLAFFWNEYCDLSAASFIEFGVGLTAIVLGVLCCGVEGRDTHGSNGDKIPLLRAAG